MSTEERWIVLYDRYEGYTAKAVNLAVATVSRAVDYCVPVYCCEQATEALLAENNIVWIGTAKNESNKILFEKGILKENTARQGYTLKVCDSIYNAEKQMILIQGNDEIGTLYGAADFNNKYAGDGAYRLEKYQITTDQFFHLPFHEKMPEYCREESPSFEERGIWTWGYCIYDYKKFFQNMLSLKLNLAVIWNDYPPVNAKEIVEYAHSLGIKIVWGFSWGWNVNCNAPGFRIDDERVIAEWGQKVLAQYEREYAHTGADGLYFQSFTETPEDSIGGVGIAETVVKWVNHISGVLLEKYPELQIQFGLHASSVKRKLQYIREVNPKVAIVWEDCGSFPYHYRPQNVANFQETMRFNEEIYTLRAEKEHGGAVLKGMTTLDWATFQSYAGPYVLGEQSEEYTKDRTAKKKKWWKYLQAFWLENASYAYEMIAQIQKLSKGKAVMQMLVEDGCFEEKVFFPAALCAEMLWNCNAKVEELLRQVALFPQVTFANNQD